MNPLRDTLIDGLPAALASWPTLGKPASPHLPIPSIGPSAPAASKLEHEALAKTPADGWQMERSQAGIADYGAHNPAPWTG